MEIPGQVHLFEDNSTNFNFVKGQYNWVTLSWNGKKGSVSRTGNYKQQVYKINGWEKAGD
jgi:hypothetical protein